MNNQGFVELNENEQSEVNGGGVVAAIIITAVVAAGGTIVGNEALERNTGKDISAWIGTGLAAAGEWLSSVGEWLMA